MENPNLKVYLELIQALLDCPKGEEWNLLQQHEELITPELLQVLHGVANQLASEGQTNQAKFLHQWEAQLAHLLPATPQAVGGKPQEKTEAYLGLIQTLLESPKGAEPEILASHRELIDPGLVQTMHQVSAQLAAKGNQKVAIYLRHLAADIDRLLQDSQYRKAEPQQSVPDLFRVAVPKQPAASRSISAPQQVMGSEPKISGLENDAFNEIVQALANLEALIANRLQPINPLWYMEIMERAHQCEWVLSSEQVEQLIGIKPQCPPGKNAFHRDGWIFIKVLPMESHLGWRVAKELIELPAPAGSATPVTEKKPPLAAVKH